MTQPIATGSLPALPDLNSAQVREALMHPSDDLLLAVEAVILAQANLAYIAPRVDSYQRAILNSHQFHIAKEWVDKSTPDQIILDPGKSYLLDNRDFSQYLSECREARDKSGMSVEKDSQCPKLMAEEQVRLMKRCLINALEPITGVTFGHVVSMRGGLAELEQYANLAIKLIAPHLDTEAEKVSRAAARPKA